MYHKPYYFPFPEPLTVHTCVLFDHKPLTEYEFIDQVKKVNGVKIDNLKHLCELVEKCTNERVRFDLDEERVVVLDFRRAKVATSRILRRHRIASPMSNDLFDSLKTEPAVNMDSSC